MKTATERNRAALTEVEKCVCSDLEILMAKLANELLRTSRSLIATQRLCEARFWLLDDIVNGASHGGE